jgi:hypothetical protein
MFQAGEERFDTLPELGRRGHLTVKWDIFQNLIIGVGPAEAPLLDASCVAKSSRLI